jgi:predicted phosphoribosyltransferase
MVAAFKEFGPRAERADVLVAVLDATPETLAAVRALIRCDPAVPAISLAEYYPARVDIPWVRKLYAITDEELAFGTLLDAAVGKLATDDLPKVSQLPHLK